MKLKSSMAVLCLIISSQNPGTSKSSRTGEGMGKVKSLYPRIPGCITGKLLCFKADTGNAVFRRAKFIHGIPDQKAVWLVTDSKIYYTEDININGSLKEMITTGKGQPNAKEKLQQN
jgi:hypothetical protein